MTKLKKLQNRIKNFAYDTKDFGFFIASTNFFWPFINKLPRFLGSKIMEFKHLKIISKLKSNHLKTIEHYIKLSANKKQEEQTSNPNFVIWICWLQGEDQMPKIPKICYDNITKYSNGIPIEFITKKNYSSFINIPEYIVEKYNNQSINDANFTDIIRTFLLAEYGGCWIDSTVFISKEISIEYFKFPFYSIKTIKTGYYVTENKWSNFFLISSKNSILFKFVKDIFLEYFLLENRPLDYFLMDYIIRLGYENIEEIKRSIDNFPFNNPNVHKLSPQIELGLVKENYHEMAKNTSIFKLSWRIKKNIEMFEKTVN